MKPVEYLDVADFIVIASEILRCDEADVLKVLKVAAASSALGAPETNYFGVELFQPFHLKVAVLGYRILRNHPLPDGNKRCAFLSMIEMLERNGCEWVVADEDETVRMIEQAAAGVIDEATFATWVASQILMTPAS